MDNELKESNPKDIISTSKLPLHLFPATGTALGCVAFLNGMLKYGLANWRAIGVRCSVYLDACKRHIQYYEEGEWADNEGVPHLASAIACLVIINDARCADKLIDDRVISGGYKQLVEELTPIVSRLRELHKDKNPKHYTIDDNTCIFSADRRDNTTVNKDIIVS